MDCTRLTCPDCRSVLRPAKPVPFGKQVKCPKCGNPFFAPGLSEEEEEARPRKKKTSGKKAKAGIKKAGGPKPPPKKPIHDDEDEESGGIYSFEGANQQKSGEEDEKPNIEYAPDMSIKDLRGPAQALVVKPSNYMLLVGGVCCLANIFLICLQFWPMIFSESVVDWEKVLATHYKDEKNSLSRVQSIKEYKELKDKDLDIVQAAEDEERIVRFEWMGVFIFLFFYNSVAIIGAVKMQNLESRRWGIASSIMTLLPMGAFGFGYLIYFTFTRTIGGWMFDELSEPYGIGMGVLPYLFAIYAGVSSLRVLLRQDVVDGFEYVAD